MISFNVQNIAQKPVVQIVYNSIHCIYHYLHVVDNCNIHCVEIYPVTTVATSVRLNGFLLHF